MSRVFVITGHTESYDQIGPYVFNRVLNDKEIDEFLRLKLPTEYEEVGFVNWMSDEVDIISV